MPISISDDGEGGELMEVKTRYGHFRAGRSEISQPWYIGEFYIKPKYRSQGHGRALAMLFPVYCWLEASAWDRKNGGILQHQLVRFYSSLGFRCLSPLSTYMRRDLRKSGWPRNPHKKPL